MSSSDSSSDSGSGSFSASAGAASAAAAPPAAAPAPAAGADPMALIRDPTSLSPKHLANSDGQIGSTSTLAALQRALIFSAVMGTSSSWRMRALYTQASSDVVMLRDWGSAITIICGLGQF